jgi:hypothetical protein
VGFSAESKTRLLVGILAANWLKVAVDIGVSQIDQAF